MGSRSFARVFLCPFVASKRWRRQWPWCVCCSLKPDFLVLVVGSRSAAQWRGQSFGTSTASTPLDTCGPSSFVSARLGRAVVGTCFPPVWVQGSCFCGPACFSCVLAQAPLVIKPPNLLTCPAFLLVCYGRSTCSASHVTDVFVQG